MVVGKGGAYDVNNYVVQSTNIDAALTKTGSVVTLFIIKYSGLSIGGDVDSSGSGGCNFRCR